MSLSLGPAWKTPDPSLVPTSFFLDLVLQGQMVAGWKGSLHPREVNLTKKQALCTFLVWESNVDRRNPGLAPEEDRPEISG